MADYDIDFERLGVTRDEESLFARGEDDVLVRREAATRAQFDEEVTVTIDGESIKVPRAQPVTDALGNEVTGPDGQLVPRATTIYDAALALVRRQTRGAVLPGADAAALQPGRIGSRVATGTARQRSGVALERVSPRHGNGDSDKPGSRSTETSARWGRAGSGPVRPPANRCVAE